MHGFLVVNKPEGLSSFDVVRRIRRVCGTRKVGHGGTLDPLATGVLPIAIGHATRLLEFLMDGKKIYRARLRLGATTDTQDCQGSVLEERSWSGVTADRIQTVLQDYLGEIEQLPPMYSALKHQGQPLYKLARQGVTVERSPRRITIHAISLLRVDLPEVEFEVVCSKGTYVRTLIHDIGQTLGCGAHMAALERTAAMPFRLDQAVEFAALEPGKPLEKGWVTIYQSVAHLPQGRADATAVNLLKNGVPPRLGQVAFATPPENDTLVALCADSTLLALARFGGIGRPVARGDFDLLKVFHY